LEIVTNDLGEESRVGFGGVGAWGKVGDGDAGFRFAKSSSGAEPILRQGGIRHEQCRENAE
jgi:hypothetical protein